MKKIIALIIAGLMVLSFAACGEKEDANETTTGTEETSSTEAGSTEAGSTEEAPSDEAPSEEAPSDEAVAGVKVEGSVSEAYVKAFKELAADGSLSALEIAEKFAEKIEAPMMLGAMDMTEAEFFQGFNEEFTVEGFEEAATYMPMIGSIPFISYVFKLSDDADKDAFKTSLEENANPRWLVCVAADETAVEVEGNYVFLIMCPAEFQYESADAGMEELA